MNERIRELQIQADEYADEIFDRKGKMYGEIVMEKFAELIVRECVEIAKDVNKNPYLDEHHHARQIIKNITKHFGIEP